MATAIPNPKTLTKQNYQEVVYMKGHGNYTMLHFYSGQQILFPYTLAIFENHLVSQHGFVRIHRGYLVNKQFIAYACPTELCLSTGCWLPIARRRSQIFNMAKVQNKASGTN